MSKSKDVKSVKFGGMVALVSGPRASEAIDREDDAAKYSDLIVYAVKYGCDVRVKSAVTGRSVGFIRGGRSTADE